MADPIPPCNPWRFSKLGEDDAQLPGYIAAFHNDIFIVWFDMAATIDTLEYWFFYTKKIRTWTDLDLETLYNHLMNHGMKQR